MSKNYSGSLALSKLQSMLMTTKKGTKGIFIPIEQNHLIEGEKGIYLPINVHVNDEPDQYGQDGFLSQKVGSETWKNATESEKEEFKKLPILGNFKDFSGTSNDNAGMQNSEPMDEDDSGLPF